MKIIRKNITLIIGLLGCVIVAFGILSVGISRASICFALGLTICISAVLRLQLASIRLGERNIRVSRRALAACQALGISSEDSSLGSLSAAASKNSANYMSIMNDIDRRTRRLLELLSTVESRTPELVRDIDLRTRRILELSAGQSPDTVQMREATGELAFRIGTGFSNLTQAYIELESTFEEFRTQAPLESASRWQTGFRSLLAGLDMSRALVGLGNFTRSVEQLSEFRKSVHAFDSDALFVSSFHEGIAYVGEQLPNNIKRIIILCNSASEQEIVYDLSRIIKCEEILLPVLDHEVSGLLSVYGYETVFVNSMNEEIVPLNTVRGQ